MRTQTAILLLCVSAALAGCSIARGVLPQRQVVANDIAKYHGHDEEREVLLPPVGTQTKAALGDSMVSVVRERIRVDLTLQPETLTGDWPSDPTLTYSVELPGGTFTRVGGWATGEYYKIGLVSVTWHYKGSKPYSEPFVAYLHRIRDRMELLWHYPGTTEQYGSSTVKGKAERKETSWAAGGPSFRREMVYTGRSGNSITLLYREFQNDMARPAFSQQLQYDIGADPVIGYKGARFRVVAADNTSITYEVLSHLTGP